MLVVSTVNVNGVRAAAPKGLASWLADSRADVVCVQEVRAREPQLRAALGHALDGWHVALAEADAPGRSGVAVLSRTAPADVRVGIGAPEFDGSGRYVEVDLPGLTVGSLYLPKGEAGTPRQEVKDRFLDAFATHLRERREKAAADGRELLVGGDWNIAPTPADLRNWRGNQKHSGFLPHEREWVAVLLADGLVDVVRAVHPGVDGPYTWWSYRGRAFDNDTGWRIDHVFATPDLAQRAVHAVVERAPSHPQRWSDHAPVTVGFREPA